MLFTALHLPRVIKQVIFRIYLQFSGFPFADDRTLKTAQALNLPNTVEELQKLVSKDDFPRLIAALVRVQLAGSEDEILKKVE